MRISFSKRRFTRWTIFISKKSDIRNVLFFGHCSMRVSGLMKYSRRVNILILSALDVYGTWISWSFWPTFYLLNGKDKQFLKVSNMFLPMKTIQSKVTLLTAMRTKLKDTKTSHWYMILFGICLRYRFLTCTTSFTSSSNKDGF